MYFLVKDPNLQVWEKDLYETSKEATIMFEQANEILGFSITNIMFGEDEDALKQTKVTQPAIFLHSVILSKVLGDSFTPEMVAGHSFRKVFSLSFYGVFII